MDNAEILHFNFEKYKIWMQKFCRAIFPLNPLKNQQQMDNAEILHFNFEKYKIWMQKILLSHISAKTQRNFHEADGKLQVWKNTF